MELYTIFSDRNKQIEVASAYIITVEEIYGVLTSTTIEKKDKLDHIKKIIERHMDSIADVEKELERIG